MREGEERQAALSQASGDTWGEGKAEGEGGRGRGTSSAGSHFSLAPPLTRCEALGKLLNLSVLPSLPCKIGSQ